MASLKVVSIQRAMPGLDSPLQMPCQARVGTGQMKDEEVRRMGLPSVEGTNRQILEAVYISKTVQRKRKADVIPERSPANPGGGHRR